MLISKPWGGRHRLADPQRGGLADFRPELLAEFSSIVGEHRRLVAGARDGNVAKAGVEQVGMDASIGVDQDALGGEALGTVAGDGVAMIEMAMFGRVELDEPVIIRPRGNSAIRRDGFDHGKIAVGDARAACPEP